MLGKNEKQGLETRVYTEYDVSKQTEISAKIFLADETLRSN